MGDFEVTAPNGKKFIVTAPEGASQDEVLAYAQSQFASAQPEKPAPSTARGALQYLGEASAAMFPVGAAEKLGSIAKPSILPTAGSIALPAAMTAIAGPANVPFIPLEQGLGSGGGEALNQLFGITEPSLKQIGMSTAIPTALGYGANAIRAVGNFLPSSAGPGALNTLAPQEATARIAGMRGAQAATPLFQKAASQGTLVPVSHTKSLMNTVLQDANISTAEKRAFRKVLNDSGLSEFLSQDIRGLNPARIQRVLNATGQLVPDATGYEGAHLKRLFGALSDDLDDAANAVGAGAATLKQARDLFKREKVLTELEKEIASAFKVNRGQGAQGQFSANKIINTLKDTSEGTGKYFSQAFSKAEQKEMIGFFEFLNEIPGLGAPAGVTRGSEMLLKNVGKSVTTGTIGGSIGFALGGPPGAAIGSGIGVAIPPSLETIKLMGMAWQMQGGKEMLKGLMANSDGAMTPRVLATLGAFISGQTSRRTTQEPPMMPSTQLRPIPLER